jgi:16S rRNA (uracil1498-N3)-methyltransferase
MTLPYFYYPGLQTGALALDEDTSRHVISVLRMNDGDTVLLTNGRGSKGLATITSAHRKHCVVAVSELTQEAVATPPVTVGISLLKNTSRFEWFLEKATEIGVTTILPLLCERTEKEKFRADRLTSILVSAMLQSQQCWLPHMGAPVEFHEAVKQQADRKYIAHCIDNSEKIQLHKAASSSIVLIGPEGDFTSQEIDAALQNDFRPVTLGHNRLRTETAGMVAATLLRLG